MCGIYFDILNDVNVFFNSTIVKTLNRNEFNFYIYVITVTVVCIQNNIILHNIRASVSQKKYEFAAIPNNI